MGRKMLHDELSEFYGMIQQLALCVMRMQGMALLLIARESMD
jgi:hypothetical protein